MTPVDDLDPPLTFATAWQAFKSTLLVIALLIVLLGAILKLWDLPISGGH